MCGRYTLYSSAEEIAEHFDLDPERLSGFEPRYNAAPGQEVPAVGPSPSAEGSGLARFRWGLVPHWTEDPTDLPNLVNVRAETAHRKPAFRGAFARRRCLVPATGFYEWVRGDGGKRPHHIRPADGGLISFGGIWERWEDPDGRPVHSLAILTTEASETVRPLHGRMPVIVRASDYGLWLDREVTEREELERLLRPRDEEPRFEHHPVSTRVNSPRNDDPTCVEPVTDE